MLIGPVAACFDPQIPQGLACQESGECPPGQQCDPIDMVCRDTLLPDGGGQFDNDPDGPDAGVDDDDPPGEFGTPVKIDAVSMPGVADDDPSLTSDELEIYFNRNSDILYARRNSRTDPFGAPQAVAVLNSTDADENPGVARDGLTIWFSSDRDGVEKLYVSTRSTRTASWSAPQRVVELDNGSRNWGASVAADGLTMIFLRDAGGLNYLPHQTRRSSPTAAWGTPVLLSELDSPGRDHPKLSADGRSVVIGSDRSGSPGSLRDLFIASRASVTAPFGEVVPIAVINSAGDDNDPWLSDDGRRLYFKTNTPGGDADLYVSSR